jgi:hypothetical protein
MSKEKELDVVSEGATDSLCHVGSQSKAVGK